MAGRSCAQHRLLLKKAEVLTQRHHPAERATTLNNFACYYRRLGKLHSAMTSLKRALELEKRLEDVRNAADTQLNMCAVLSQLGKHQEALENAQEALITLQEGFIQGKPPDGASEPGNSKLDRISVMCIAYHNIGVEQEFLKDYAESVASYKKGIGLAEQYLGEAHSITTTIRNSYLAAKRTMATKARARPCSAQQSPNKAGVRLLSPRSGSLRMPSPLAKEKDRHHVSEIPTPRSIIAEALARGPVSALPPLELPSPSSASKKKKKPTSGETKDAAAQTLSPTDPFFSPRFRFDEDAAEKAKRPQPLPVSQHVEVRTPPSSKGTRERRKSSVKKTPTTAGTGTSSRKSSRTKTAPAPPETPVALNDQVSEKEATAHLSFVPVQEPIPDSVQIGTTVSKEESDAAFTEVSIVSPRSTVAAVLSQVVDRIEDAVDVPPVEVGQEENCIEMATTNQQETSSDVLDLPISDGGELLLEEESPILESDDRSEGREDEHNTVSHIDHSDPDSTSASNTAEFTEEDPPNAEEASSFEAFGETVNNDDVVNGDIEASGDYKNDQAADESASASDRLALETWDNGVEAPADQNEVLYSEGATVTEETSRGDDFTTEHEQPAPTSIEQADDTTTEEEEYLHEHAEYVDDATPVLHEAAMEHFPDPPTPLTDDHTWQETNATVDLDQLEPQHTSAGEEFSASITQNDQDGNEDSGVDENENINDGETNHQAAVEEPRSEVSHDAPEALEDLASHNPVAYETTEQFDPALAEHSDDQERHEPEDARVDGLDDWSYQATEESASATAAVDYNNYWEEQGPDLEDQPLGDSEATYTDGLLQDQPNSEFPIDELTTHEDPVDMNAHPS